MSTAAGHRRDVYEVSVLELLDKIRTPADVRALPAEQLPALCGEIRRFLVEQVAAHGGHLSSNLGVVELTVALHRVYDTEKDRLVFDVGHQCYVHKLLTGRREAFDTLRCLNGLSGFPKPCESVHDAFIAGHASNSVSAALGMARTRTRLGQDCDVIALIGDGALTGGLAYEALSDAGASGEPLVVLLNDNGMSIKPNVGGIARLLRSTRVKRGYLDFKRGYRRVMEKLPALYRLTHRIKEWLKVRLLGSNMFEDMGFYYLGPVDGHDCAQLESALQLAREMRQPVLLHALTQKGKGCGFAEREPDVYHGVGGYDPVTGAIPPSKTDFSSVFGEALVSLAEQNSSVFAVTAAMEQGTGLGAFASRFPDRFFDVGIAEEHAVAMAAGMAKQGAVPVVAVYSSFLQRAYDMLIHDVALQNLHVVFCVDRAGLVGRDGETHHGLFDVDYLCSVPGMTVLCPASFAELREMLTLAVNELSGPVAIRYPRGGEGIYTEDRTRESAGVLRAGEDLTLVAYGTMICEALAAADRLAAEGVRAEVIRLGLIRPLDPTTVFESVKKTGALLVAEEVCASGCVGLRLAAALEKEIIPARVRTLNLGAGVVQHGTVSELRAQCGIDAQGIALAARALLRGTP